MSYEQMEMDLRLQPERDLDENIGVLMSFAHQQLMSEMPDGAVKNRHEGYGILAEKFVAVGAAMKAIQDGMKSYLRILPVDDYKAVDAVSSIDNSLTDLVTATVKMAAEAKRINDDLFRHASETKTPLEDYMDSQGDGFEEAEDEESTEEE
jgi:hypothetical protein